MLKFINDRIKRLLYTEEYGTDINKINRGLEWIVFRPNYRALLKCFIEDELATASEISPDEISALLKCILIAETGRAVSAASFPLLKSMPGRVMLGQWLSDATRSDLGLMPETRDHIVPITSFCDDRSRRPIARTFEALGYSDGRSLSCLKEHAQGLKLHYWVELLPFVLGPCFAFCARTVTLRDALFLPRVGSEFFYNTSIGAVIINSPEIVVIRKSAAKDGLNVLNKLPIASPIRPEMIEPILRSRGWSTRTI